MTYFPESPLADQFIDPIHKMAHESALRSIGRVVTETVTPTPPGQALPAIVHQLRSGGVLVLTGAGVSTDSGIPDYRGAQGSLKRHRPMTYQEFRFDPQALKRYWARSFIGWRYIDRAQPNAVHGYIAEWERAGQVVGVVTQNVDGLHQLAGSRNILPLHGDLATVICLDCGQREDRHAFDARMAEINAGFLESITIDPTAINPDGDVALAAEDVERFHCAPCANCGSTVMKPDVVYFGESVPRQRKERLQDLLVDASSVLVLGSSLAVMSGMRIVIDAKKQGKPVSIVNAGPSRADNRMDIVWRSLLRPACEKISEALVGRRP
ncbi:NAD-dependent protein deacetylase, SIR2 family [Corynebacterium mustelae]|uniref:protein acetyllysine N-acetyltransferase n=2 Tax=Corynebacterium mustelae TaxID=571915 RepID=A0A0G3GTG7_9CORY|nr:NAD-dependent protein deacetylase, SIR2 family [Corynebacterium mustelae]